MVSVNMIYAKSIDINTNLQVCLCFETRDILCMSNWNLELVLEKYASQIPCDLSRLEKISNYIEGIHNEDNKHNKGVFAPNRARSSADTVL